MTLGEFKKLMEENNVPDDWQMKWDHESGAWVTVRTIELHNDVGTILLGEEYL